VSDITIGSGSENQTALEKRSVLRRVVHPKYNTHTHDYDVGVVEVATPFIMSPVRKPIALVKGGEDPAAGERVVVSGWGYNLVSVFLQEAL